MAPPAGYGERAEYAAILMEGSNPPAPASRHPAVFVPLTAAACVAVLVYEFYENGRRVEPGDEGTEDCYFRLLLQGNLFCAASLSTNPLFGPSNDVLVRIGAKRNESILRDGEAWRLVTPLFLHAGLVHLVLNMSVFLQLGLRLEAVHGALRVGAVYLASGIFGVIMSAVLSPHSISVGASGAIFGLMGASVGEVMQNWRLYERPCFALCELTCAAALQLLLGTMPMVDNFAHFFGFCMGFVTAVCMLVSPASMARHNWPMAAKCHQQLLQVVAASMAYLLFVAGLLALYGGWNAYEICPWCGKIACLPFPWGCSPSTPGSCWWDCSPCSAGGLTARTQWVGSPHNGSVSVRCPVVRGGSDGGFANVTVRPVDLSSGLASAALVELCKDHCPDGVL